MHNKANPSQDGDAKPRVPCKRDGWVADLLKSHRILRADRPGGVWRLFFLGGGRSNMNGRIHAVPLKMWFLLGVFGIFSQAFAGDDSTKADRGITVGFVPYTNTGRYENNTPKGMGEGVGDDAEKHVLRYVGERADQVFAPRGGEELLQQLVKLKNLALSRTFTEDV